MFAYCANNSVAYVDRNGKYRDAIDPSKVGAYGGLDIFGGLFLTGKILEEGWTLFRDGIANSISKAKEKSYSSEHEEHHIAAKGACKAASARAILEELYPDGVENSYNKVYLKTKVHRRVHTNLYYAITNSLIINAYASANGNDDVARELVTDTLNGIAAALKSLESLC